MAASTASAAARIVQEFGRPVLTWTVVPAPGAHTLDDYLTDAKEFFEAELGQIVHYCDVGDERESGAIGQRLVRAAKILTKGNRRQARVRGHGTERAARAADIYELAATYDLRLNQLPALVFQTLPALGRCWTISLAALDQADRAALRLLVDILMAELSGQRLLPQAPPDPREFRDFIDPIVERIRLRITTEVLLPAPVAAQVHLDATDKRILKHLLRVARNNTPEIAAALGRQPKNIGKNLSRLMRLEEPLLENRARHGYALTPHGRTVAQALISPKTPQP
jgi:hypothetical protein